MSDNPASDTNVEQATLVTNVLQPIVNTLYTLGVNPLAIHSALCMAGATILRNIIANPDERVIFNQGMQAVVDDFLRLDNEAINRMGQESDGG